MVNTALLVLVVLTLVVWLVQEAIGRRQQHWRIAQQIEHGAAVLPDTGAEPLWSAWSYKVLIALWILWVVLVVRLKDGDFALVLVLLTLLTGVIAALDRWGFERARKSAAMNLHGANAAFVAERPIAEYSRSFFPVLAVVLILRSFVVEPFQIPSSSMVPTLEVGDYILVNKFSYGLRVPVLKTKILDVGKPQRGDVVVFYPPHKKNVYFIKRLVGLPGDHIQYRHKVLYINGDKAEQTFLARLLPMQGTELASEKLGPVEHNIHKQMDSYNEIADNVDVVVEPGHYFFMGDNRDNSADSRFWGQVPEQEIVGKAFAVWMHWESLSIPSFDRVGKIH
ncbi:MAG: lepB [Verrucomicrobiaceae bacterium]|nr:lepB [Verrucomicrobiaceae bacterium]